MVRERSGKRILDEKKKSRSLGRVTEKTRKTKDLNLIAWGPVFLGVVTPIFYLNGKAFHEGYLGYLNLEASMFPIDTSSTLTYAVSAWLYATIAGMKVINDFLGENWLYAGGLFLVSVFMFGLASFLVKKYSKKIEGARRESKIGPGSVKLGDEVARWVVLLFIPGYALFCLMLIIALLILCAIGPFVSVGGERAAEDLKKEFSNSPQVKVLDRKGVAGDYRVVLCSSQFCALYSQGKVISVPLATIDFAVSDVSGKRK